MAEYLIQDTTLIGIANAIREKTRSSSEISVNDMATKIREIKTLVDYENTSITTVGDYAYYANSNNAIAVFNSVSFPKATSIGKYVFSSQDNLISVDFPLVTTVGEYAFNYCDKLTVVNLPVATNLGKSAFSRCITLKNISLPKVTNLRDYTFLDCSELETIDAPLATHIGFSCCLRNAKLTEVNTPLVEIVDTSAFSGCESLTSINLPKLRSIGTSVFSGCKSLTSINLPKLYHMDDSAFSGCTSLEFVELPGMVDNSYIGTNAFRNSNLSIIVFPNATTVIGVEGDTMFANTPIAEANGSIYVPDTLVKSYKVANGWSTYANCIKPMSEYVATI